jgi:hypothetical protein
MNTAGTAAQRCGWSVNRWESPNNDAQPIANPHRTAPLTAASVTGTTGTKARATAARTPVEREAATIPPRRQLGLVRGVDGPEG